MIYQCQAKLPNLNVEQLVKRYQIERARQRWAPIYKRLLTDVEQLSQPAAICHEFSLDDVTELDQWLPGQTISVVLAVCTLGPQLDTHLKELTEKDLLSTVIMNEISLAMINAMTREIHAAIRREKAGCGLKAGAPYRPGVGRWPLFLQEFIFDRLPAQQIGITLDEFLLMRPVKSTSMIIPILDKRMNSYQR